MKIKTEKSVKWCTARVSLVTDNVLINGMSEIISSNVSLFAGAAKVVRKIKYKHKDNDSGKLT